MPAERGQASVELLGAVPAVLLVGAVVLQLLAIGYAASLAGVAAEAGAPPRGGAPAARGAGGEGWRGEPAAPRPVPVERALPPRPVVAVVGLGRRCGTTT